MPLTFRPRVRRTPMLNITSLIDVLFLLLIFFMLSSTFIEHPAILLDLPTAGTAESARTDSLTLSITPDGDFYLNDVPTPLNGLGPKLRAAVATEPDIALILKADTTVAYGIVIAAIDVAKDAGVRHITAFTDLPPVRPSS